MPASASSKRHIPGAGRCAWSRKGLHGAATATRFVAVTTAAPRIQLNHRTILGAPGTPAEFRWTITHARAAFIDFPARHERHKVELSDGLKTKIGQTHEEFLLTTVGLDGRHQTIVLATGPYAYPDFLSPQ
jgi:hypothetical protein